MRGTAGHAEDEIRDGAAIDGVFSRRRRHRHPHHIPVVIRLLGLTAHRLLVAGRLVVRVVAEKARRHRQQMLERHGPLLRLEVRREGAAVHDLVHGTGELQRHAVLHRGAGHERGETLSRRSQIVQLIALVTVEVLLDEQLPMPRHEERVKLRRVARVHRHVEEALDELLDRGAVDAFRVECAHRPAVVAAQRCAVDVAFRTFAARVERAVVRVANEIVRPAAAGKAEHEDLVLRVVRAGGDFQLLPAARADQLHHVALAGQPVDRVLRPDVAFRIAQDRAEGTVGALLHEEIKGERVLERIDDAAPLVRIDGLQRHE
ncbi:MAG TPA: hypothetical protein VEK11_08025 [Thermoanaerobaculia bacterium]|nr:hypothetical protein [Thermoanaerobaculia bacterium]